MDGSTGDRVWGARRITALYLVLGVGWIVVSDFLVTWARLGSQTVLTAQLAKGSLFVAGSAAVLYTLVGREQRALEATNTELAQSLRHVSVLHRVLRHNLRNSCDVIQNNAAFLADGTADDDALVRIDRQARQLGAIAEKSRHLRDVMLDDADEVVLSVASVVDEAVESLDGHVPTVTREIDTALSVRVHPRFVVAVGELLRNAVKHHDEASPTVAVSAAEDGDWTAITISDDGPGLPEHEHTALAGSHEEPLRHSRGIGLWLVRFLVEASDGTLAVDSSPDGTDVVIRVPTASQ